VIRVESPRPFYGSFAWAYDAVVDRPVVAESDHIDAILRGRGAPPGARVLDAGCGTGQYAAQLARRGYRVTGVDRSPELLGVARGLPPARLAWVLGDVTSLPLARRFDAVLCRGVLNDLLEDADRRAVLREFAAALVNGGVLVFDVREWEASARRALLRPVHQRTVETIHGTLTFRSETTLDRERRRLVIAERHELSGPSGTTTAVHDFAMRAWTRDEIEALLGDAGFTSLGYRGDYGDVQPVGTTDRLIVIASR
jgi:SAM-dependent methyltransferase